MIYYHRRLLNNSHSRQVYPIEFHFLAISTLLQKHCSKKQETEECNLKLCGYVYHQGTYTL